MTITLKKDTLNLINKYSCDDHCLELLQLFAKYPCTRFNKLAIVHALNNGGLQIIDKALKRLVDNKLICTSSQNSLVIYSLTEDITQRSAVSGLAALDLPQWRLLLKEQSRIEEKQNHAETEKKKTPAFLADSVSYRPVPLISLAAK